MYVYEGSSQATDALQAVREATAAFPEGKKIDMIFAFHSTKQDAGAVARELAARFPGAHLAGCTTAGEHLSGRHMNGSLVIACVSSLKTRWAIRVVEDLDGFDRSAAEAARDALLSSLGRTVEDLDPAKHFCVGFMDGLAGKEEGVAAAMAEALVGVQLVGGSAGDDLQFKRTRVLADGRAYDRAAVFVLGESQDGFRVLKNQHFVTTRRLLAVTEVDVAQRRVIELDGLPAAEAYARALGISRVEFNTDVAFANPLAFECNGEVYVRSVQRIDDDGSIVLYCAIDKGTVLDVAGHLELDAALAEGVGRPARKAGLLLACNCILRALETDKVGKHDALGGILRGVSDHVIGFDTYGEQLNGLHINQTIVGLALGEVAS